MSKEGRKESVKEKEEGREGRREGGREGIYLGQGVYVPGEQNIAAVDVAMHNDGIGGGGEGGKAATWVRVCMSPVSRTLLLLMSRCTMEGLSPWM